MVLLKIAIATLLISSVITLISFQLQEVADAINEAGIGSLSTYEDNNNDIGGVGEKIEARTSNGRILWVRIKNSFIF